MGDKQRTHIHPFLDPKLAVESIGEVPRVPRAHLEVKFAQTIVRFSPLPCIMCDGGRSVKNSIDSDTEYAHTSMTIRTFDIDSLSIL